VDLDCELLDQYWRPHGLGDRHQYRSREVVQFLIPDSTLSQLICQSRDASRRAVSCVLRPHDKCNNRDGGSIDDQSEGPDSFSRERCIETILRRPC
jgi:hypothetical protein